MRTLDLLIKAITFGKNPYFLTQYCTTIGETIYVPDDWYIWSDYVKHEVLSHELIHVKQFQKYGTFLFSILYLFFPLPFCFSYFRTKMEMEAYAESLRIVAEYKGVDFLEKSSYREFTIGIFTGPSYGWMMINRKFVEDWYDSEVEKIKK